MTPEHTDMTGAARLREALERTREALNDYFHKTGSAGEIDRAYAIVSETLAAVPEARDDECLHWHIERLGTACGPSPVAVCVQCGARFVCEPVVPEAPERCTCGNGEAEDDRGAVLRCPVHGLNSSEAPEPGRIDSATRLRLLEAALRDRDWMRVMDVVEDMGGNWRIGQRERVEEGTER